MPHYTTFDAEILNKRVKKASKKAIKAMQKALEVESTAITGSGSINSIPIFTSNRTVGDSSMCFSYGLFIPASPFPTGYSVIRWSLPTNETNQVGSNGITITGDHNTDLTIAHQGVYYIDLMINCDITSTQNVQVLLYMNGTGDNLTTGTGTMVQASEKWGAWNGMVQFQATYMFKAVENQVIYMVFNNISGPTWNHASSSDAMWSRMMIHKIA